MSGNRSVIHRRGSVVGDIACVLMLFGLYGPISTVFGLGHNNTFYALYYLVVGLIIFLSVYFEISAGARFSRKSLFGLIFVVFIGLQALFIFASGYETSVTRNMFLYFMCFGVIGYFAGCYAGIANRLRSLVKYFDIVAWLLLACSLHYSLQGNAGSTIESGMNYQEASYAAALALGIFVLFLTTDLNTYRFSFASSPLYVFLELLSTPVALLLSFSSGGRGGALLALGLFFYLLIKLLVDQSRRKRIVPIGAMLVLCLVFSSYFVSASYMQAGFDRVLSALSLDVLNGTSNAASNSISARNILRDEAVQLFYASPVWGSGFFICYQVLGVYPHNIILEMLAQGGLILVLFFAVASGKMFSDAQKVSKRKPEYKCLAVIFVYVFTMLMFSGTYLTSSCFWFLVGVCLSLPDHSSERVASSEVFDEA